MACVAVAAGVAWLRAGASSSSAALAPPSPTTAEPASVQSTASSTRSGAVLVVDVVGAVRRSGVVRVPAGARVIDAIAAAGGALPAADLARLNLAAPVTDGTRIAVPLTGAPAPAIDPGAVSGVSPPGGTGTPSAAAPLNLNSATAEQLDTLPGVGPATAAAIVKDREAHGPFRSVNDLGRVRGIGDAKLDQLRDLVTV